MNGSLRQKAALAVLGVIALFLVAALVWFTSAQTAWKRSARRYDDAKAKYLREVALIADKAKWDAAYEEAKSVMPSFATGKATDTTWLQKVGEIASRQLIYVTKRNAGQEEIIGDVTMLPIDMSFECSLEALVKFLHELENTDQGLFAVSKLNFVPSAKKGYLRGSFTLSCAYMRE